MINAVSLVSIVIPAFNARPFLSAAIASARAQTTAAFETIVVDDGSNDSTHVIAERAGARVIRQPNRGPAAARNAGIQATTGRWIGLLDADDIWHPEKIERQLRLSSLCPDAAVISCDRSTTRDGRVVEQSYLDTLEGYPSLVRYRIGSDGAYLGHVDQNFLKTGCVLLPSTLLIRRDVFSNVGFFCEHLCGLEDFEFLLRVLARHALAIVENQLVTYRLHDANLHDDISLMQIGATNLLRLVRANPERYLGGTSDALAWVSYM